MRYLFLFQIRHPLGNLQGEVLELGVIESWLEGVVEVVEEGCVPFAFEVCVFRWN